MWISLAVAAGTAAFLWKSRANYRALPELPRDSTDTPTHGVTVIVPARNEAHQIARCLSGFAEPKIVVDDASTDGTAEVARQCGACVITAPPLAPNDLGKPNACAAGARLARTEWLLFVDADTWFENGFARSAAAYAEREGLDLLSAFPRQQRVTWAERLILPYAFALYFCGVSARSVNSPGGEALANGQCLLVRRDAYERIGGHTAVKQSVIEDVALARRAKQQGLRVRVARAEQMGSVRMYDSLGAIWRGLEKNSFRFLRVNPWTGAQVMAASILLTSWLPAVLVSGDWRVALVAGAAPVIALKPWYGRWREALFAPAGIYLFQLIALSGMVKSLTGGKSVWKGRNV